MNISNINVFKFKINKILLKKVGKNMLKQKKPVVFEPKNLESLIQGLDKKDLESLIKIIKYKIESAYTPYIYRDKILNYNDIILNNESKNVNEVTKKKHSHIDMKLYLLENIYKNKICKKAILINNHAK